MLNSSMRFDERSRILKWMGTVGIEEAAAIRAPFLNDLLRSNRPLRDRLGRDGVHYRLTVCVHNWFAVCADTLYLLRFDQFHGVIGLQILHDTLRHEQQSADNTKWQQYPEAGAHHVDPEVANGLHLAARNAANKGNGECDSNRRGNEVVIGEAGHLGEVAHRGLAGIGLPVRIRGKRRSGIECHMLGRDCRQMLRIEGQHALHALEEIQKQHGNRTEQQHGGRIFRPAHFVLFIDAGESIEQAFDRPQHGIQKRALAGKDPSHKNPHRLGNGEDQRQEHEDLKPTVDRHIRSIKTSPDAAAHRTDKSWSAR